jgi:Family of unknown function (DUF5684)
MSSVIWIIYVLVWLIVILAFWRIFTKAGEAGWKSIIPIWNTLVLLRIVGRPWWWIILLFIPIVNIVVWIIVALNLSKSYGHGNGFGVGLILLPFIFGLILGYGSDTYRGPAGAGAV